MTKAKSPSLTSYSTVHTLSLSLSGLVSIREIFQKEIKGRSRTGQKAVRYRILREKEPL